MSAAQPELKSNELLEKMNQLAQLASRDEFALMRLRRDAADVKSASRIHGEVIEAALLVLAGDFDRAFTSTKKLLNLYQRNDWVLLNSTVTLIRIGRLPEMSEIIIQQALSQGDKASVLWLALKTAYMSGHISDVQTIAMNLARLGEPLSIEEIRTMNEDFISAGVTDAHTQQISEFAYQTFRNYKQGMFLGRPIRTEPDGMIDESGHSWLTNRVYIPMLDEHEVADIIALNDQLCVGMAEESFDGNPALSRFIFDFILEDPDGPTS